MRTGMYKNDGPSLKQKEFGPEKIPFDLCHMNHVLNKWN